MAFNGMKTKEELEQEVAAIIATGNSKAMPELQQALTDSKSGRGKPSDLTAALLKHRRG
jgi:hypothetical protein